MTIFEDRLQECMQVLAVLLELKDNQVVKLGTQNYPVKQLVPDVLKTIQKTIMTNEERAEGILRYLADAYAYVTGMSDEMPEFENEFRPG